MNGVMEYIGNKKKQGSIVDLLKDEILSGNIPEGSEMTQKELAESLGVSRMPVREALILLEYQGLIERLPNNHVRVAQFGPDYFEQIFQMAGQIEMDELRKKSKDTLFPEGELEFHRFLYREMTHSFLKKNMETIIDIYMTFAICASSYDRKRGKSIIEQIIRTWKKEDEDKKAESLFQDYYQHMADAMRKERGQK